MKTPAAAFMEPVPVLRSLPPAPRAIPVAASNRPQPDHLQLFATLNSLNGARCGIARFERNVSHRFPQEPHLMPNAPSTTIGESTAYIVHEVNQPLSAILLNAKAALRWLQSDPPNFDEARRCIEGVVGNGRRAADIARHVRERLRKAPPVAARIDLNDVIADSLDLTSPILDHHGIIVEVELCEEIASIRGDRVQIEGLIVNLIANAAEAMSNVEGRQRKLRISSRVSEGGDVLVAVEDSGTGIDPVEIERIFDPYFTTKPEGTGLGLSICRSIVESCGGRLWAAPNRPHGTTFSFSIPSINHELLG